MFREPRRLATGLARARPGGRAHHRHQRPEEPRRRSRSSTRRAARTRRRWCRTSPTTGCSSTRTRRAAPCSAATRATRRAAVVRAASTSSRCRSANPAAASYLRFEPSGDPVDARRTEHHPCHDTGGHPRRRECSWPAPAVRRRRRQLYTPRSGQGRLAGRSEVPATTSRTPAASAIGHSASFTYDGKVRRSSGTSRAAARRRCEATSPIIERTFFFDDVATGDVAGRHRCTIPRPQTNIENCTIAQLQRRAAHEQEPEAALRHGRRQLPVGHQGRRLHGSGEREGDRLRRSAAARQPEPPSASSSAATGRPTGTTAASTSPTSRAGLIIWRLDDPAVIQFLRKLAL